VEHQRVPRRALLKGAGALAAHSLLRVPVRMAAGAGLAVPTTPRTSQAASLSLVNPRLAHPVFAQPGGSFLVEVLAASSLDLRLCRIGAALLCTLALLGPQLLHAQAQAEPLRIEAESYETFADTTPGNSGGQCRSDDVDVRVQGGSCTVGWWAEGEWLEFVVDVPAAGSYAVGARVATGLDTNRISLSSGKQTVTLPLPNTGSASSFTATEGASLQLNQGRQRLRLTGHGGSMDIDYLTLRPTDDPNTGSRPAPPPPPGEQAPRLPPPAQPANRGPVFQIACSTGQRLPDDPIVFPGRSGASHEHQFFANCSANAASTYETMLAAGTTCADSADRAGYWVPSLYAGGHTLVTPHRLRAYYYAHTDRRGSVQPFPANLRMLAGDPRATGPQPRGVIDWLCRNRRDQAAGRPLSQEQPPTCRRDEYLSLSIRFPDCWDGRNLDASDHRRHMAYADGRGACPPSHSVKLPRLRYSITYEGTSWAGGDFTLGAPAGDGKALPWYAMHADFWNTWEQGALEEYVRGCLNGGRTVRVTACQ